MRKQIIKTLALVLVFALILSAAAPPKAAAVSELVIIGGIAMTIGLAVAISLIAADSAGMKDAIINAANDGLVQTGEIMESLLRQYQTLRNFRLVNMLALFQAGTKVLQNGAIALGKDLSDFLTGFFDWAWSEEGGNLVSFAPVDGYLTANTSNIPGFPYQWGDVSYSSGVCYPPNNNYYYDCSSPYALLYDVRYNQSVVLYFSEGPLDFVTRKVSDNSQVSTSNGSLVNFIFDGNTYSYYVHNVIYKNHAQVEGFTSISGGVSTQKQAAISFLYYNSDLSGDISEPDTNVLQLPAEGAIDTNILNIPDQLVLPAPVSGTTSADKYVEAVRDAIYSGAGSLEYTDANDIAGTATLEMTGAATVDQTASAAGSLDGAVDVGEEVGSPTLDNYSIDLRNFFPFCIPFDIYDMLNLLSASRAAPVVRWRFYVPHVVDTIVEIDLSSFDPVAQTLRTIELLAFAVGLAFATKKLLMGS